MYHVICHHTNNNKNKMITLPNNIPMHMNILGWSEGCNLSNKTGPAWQTSSSEWTSWIPHQEKMNIFFNVYVKVNEKF